MASTLRRVLLVEDDAPLAGQLRWALQSDYEVRVASDRVAALEALERMVSEHALRDYRQLALVDRNGGTAYHSGARTLELPDTVGYATPEEYAALVRGVVEEVCRDRAVIVSTHCHDDLGLATANTLAGIRAGARQAEVTINGLGERAGNACL